VEQFSYGWAIYPHVPDHSDEPYSVSVNAFRQKISWIIEHGFDVVSLSFLLRSIQRRNYSLLKKKVVITLDDGYKDFLTNASPILLDHKATATVFLVTDMLGGSASWNNAGPDEQLMSEDEVRSIKAHGITLGSHTVTHANLSLLDWNDLQRQLSDSRGCLACLSG